MHREAGQSTPEENGRAYPDQSGRAARRPMCRVAVGMCPAVRKERGRLRHGTGGLLGRSGKGGWPGQAEEASRGADPDQWGGPAGQLRCPVCKDASLLAETELEGVSPLSTASSPRPARGLLLPVGRRGAGVPVWV